MTKPNLHIVTAPDEAPDIYTAWKAEIAARDWRAVHIAADRRKPIFIPDPVRGTWR